APSAPITYSAFFLFCYFIFCPRPQHSDSLTPPCTSSSSSHSSPICSLQVSFPEVLVHCTLPRFPWLQVSFP
ncbi:hypothetical protein Gotur_025505, partial [Gossypium turneri]